MVLTSKLERQLEALKEEYYQPEPNRFFEVGQKVVVGSLEDVVVVDILENGRFIVIEYTNRQKFAPSDKTGQRVHRVMPWFNVYPVVEESESLIRNKDLELTFMNTTIDSALSKIYGNGVNFDVEYQRDYCWSLEDKQDLIDSIFNHVDIGKIVLVNRDVLEPWEVLDGKQRLSTIKDFYEDKFTYKGKKYSELTKNDRNYFKMYPLPTAVLDTEDNDVIIRQFIKLNTCGKSMSKEDIERAISLMSE